MTWYIESLISVFFFCFFSLIQKNTEEMECFFLTWFHPGIPLKLIFRKEKQFS